ncbi:hypothetical protein KIP88_34695 [Bradyrhizobium sp. SRL28]|uniref:O-antigen ligase family protein n=1 Tax=Bradyrhizobium sp. SRL28 TaxID=2836178 RepID=UPI001BDF5D3C|nr:hypothetical protein [Bradyrhizobium sp. SRL28]MBT1515631.1 hypothetical protein [Bradyrhizobium sp. SRL28]
MKSSVATLALVIWPLIAVGLFSVRPAIQATLWIVVGAQLLLPVGEMIKFEMIPQFDKATIPNLCIFLGYLFVARRIWRPSFGWVEVLVLIFVLGPIATSVLNNDPIIAGDRLIPGVGIYDAGSAIGSALIVLIPFFVGRGLLWSALAIEQILKVLVVAGLLYSIPMLFEMRFSPQLHAWIYGYLPSDFIQQVRAGGYRPMVFMGHGLIAATFLFMTVAAAAALWRTNTRLGQVSSAGATAYLSVILVLCKSAGAALFGIVVVPLICFVRPRVQSLVAIGLVMVALLYPLLRFTGVVPTGVILQVTESLSTERASSLRVRFENEAMLLDHAFERPIFGWGRYGRSRVYNEEGRDMSVTDGRWVITVGQFGIVGFLAEFGLLALSVIRAARSYRLAESFRDRIFLTSLALIVSANMIDLLPNSSLLPMTWLFAGALLGRADTLRQLATRSPRVSPTGRLRYAEAEPSARPVM